MKYLISLLIILSSCSTPRVPYVIIEKSVYYREFNNILVPVYEYTYYSGNCVKVYHYTHDDYNVGDTLKTHTIKRASRKDHLLD